MDQNMEPKSSKELLACQITSPFNEKLDCFGKKNTLNFILLNGDIACSVYLTKELHGKKHEVCWSEAECVKVYLGMTVKERPFGNCVLASQIETL